MKKFSASMMKLFFTLEVLTGIALYFMHDTHSELGLRILAILRALHRSVFGWVYLGLVFLHCFLLRDLIWKQIKFNKINLRYFLILLMFIFSFLAFIPSKFFGPYPLSMIVHALAIPTVLICLIYMHIKIQKKAKAEREEAHSVAG
ncbi:MAG: hypothetical protein ACRCVN_02795 [Spirochaetia bacterium]